MPANHQSSIQPSSINRQVGDRQSSILGIYLHIPFCQAICGYCNFNRGLLDEALKARYVRGLIGEIETPGDVAAADSIFFGGGTPSLLDPDEVEHILCACNRAFDVAPNAEITLETNPETATLDRLRAFRAAGINRLSFGVQSFDAEELLRLGRVHSAKRAIEAVGAARTAGFDNVSLDLMLWLPGQTHESWARTVETAVSVQPDHLSLYLLELYPNAPLKESIARAAAAGMDPVRARDWALAADDDAADMYLDGLARLDAAGFEQYEISNVARAGRRSRHNLKYWTSGDWRGFGCGAHSTVSGVRWRNISSTVDYLDRIDAGRPVMLDRQELSPTERISEAIFTGLRLSEGIDRRNFAARFGVDPWMEHGSTLAMYAEDGLVWVSGGAFGLSRRGMLIANEILTLFV